LKDLQFNEPTIVKFKKVMNIIFINFQTNAYQKIGGLNIRVQVDETVLVRGRLITDPKSTADEIPSSVWLVGGI
jgi:hypothetical protein